MSAMPLLPYLTSSLCDVPPHAGPVQQMLTQLVPESDRPSAVRGVALVYSNSYLLMLEAQDGLLRAMLDSYSTPPARKAPTVEVCTRPLRCCYKLQVLLICNGMLASCRTCRL